MTKPLIYNDKYDIVWLPDDLRYNIKKQRYEQRQIRLPHQCTVKQLKTEMVKKWHVHDPQKPWHVAGLGWPHPVFATHIEALQYLVEYEATKKENK